MNNKRNYKYYAGIYARISKDNGIRNESGENICVKNSESIENQVSYCKDFLQDMEDVYLQEIYIDRGYSGVGFSRPGFEKMIQDIENRSINLVIVKDFSRFGRNYIGVGQYLFEKFPYDGIRFIAINDNYDSGSLYENEFPISKVLKTVADDYYAFDISKKVRSQLEIKRRNGYYAGSYVVYGYRKNDLHPEKLEVDEEVRNIVKSIFSWKIQGMSYQKIADQLNEQGILSPYAYKKYKGISFHTPFQKYEQSKWYPAAVEKIIKNRIYTGVLEQGKRKRMSYRSERLEVVPMEEWSIKEDSHEGIVTEDEYNRANVILKGGRKNNGDLFGGRMFCGECGQPMVRRVSKWKEKKTVYYICSTNNKGKGCSRHSIKESELQDIISNKIATQKIITDKGEFIILK